MKYNYKIAEKTQEAVFTDRFELLEDICETIEHIRIYEFISIYSNYKNIKKIIKWMVVLDIIDKQETLPYLDNDMVIMTISYDGNIDIEEMYVNNDKCKHSEAALTYLHDTVCKSKVINTLEENEENILCYCLTQEIEES